MFHKKNLRALRSSRIIFKVFSEFTALFIYVYLIFARLNTKLINILILNINFVFYFSGYNAKRDTVNGSWFVQKLCDVIRENAWKFDLDSLLKMVI